MLLDATHGTYWKIWGELGVGPKTKYMLTEESPVLLQKEQVKKELKRLFKIVFENDRIVLDILTDAARLISRN